MLNSLITIPLFRSFTRLLQKLIQIIEFLPVKGCNMSDQEDKPKHFSDAETREQRKNDSYLIQTLKLPSSMMWTIQLRGLNIY